MSIPATTAFLFFLVAILWFVSQMAVRHREFFETKEESLVGEGETFEDLVECLLDVLPQMPLW